MTSKGYIAFLTANSATPLNITWNTQVCRSIKHLPTKPPWEWHLQILRVGHTSNYEERKKKRKQTTKKNTHNPDHCAVWGTSQKICYCCYWDSLLRWSVKQHMTKITVSCKSLRGKEHVTLGEYLLCTSSEPELSKFPKETGNIWHAKVNTLCF